MFGAAILVFAGGGISVLAWNVADAEPGEVWRVDIDNASGVEDGLSWATAFRDIQVAVNTAAAAGGGQVWVAEGRYTHSGAHVVEIKNGVDLYGGFAGGE